jgi:hypothetical protein
MRTLAMPKAAEPWSLTSPREKLIKIGAKVVSHGRYVTFPLAEVAVSRQMFAGILSLIARLRAPPRARMRSQRHRMRQATTAEVRFGAVGGAQFSATAWSTGGLKASCARRALLSIAQIVQKSDPGLEPAGKLFSRLSFGATRPTETLGKSRTSPTVR